MRIHTLVARRLEVQDNKRLAIQRITLHKGSRVHLGDGVGHVSSMTDNQVIILLNGQPIIKKRSQIRHHKKFKTEFWCHHVTIEHKE